MSVVLLAPTYCTLAVLFLGALVPHVLARSHTKQGCNPSPMRVCPFVRGELVSAWHETIWLYAGSYQVGDPTVPVSVGPGSLAATKEWEAKGLGGAPRVLVALVYDGSCHHGCACI